MSDRPKSSLWETLTRPIPLRFTWIDGVILIALALAVLIKDLLSR